jgi:hypothetical protein
MVRQPSRAGPRHYDLRRWRRLSAAKRAADPVCEVCREEPTAEVHHLLPLDAGGQDAWANLQSVCASCHKKIQAAADLAAAASRPSPGGEGGPQTSGPCPGNRMDRLHFSRQVLGVGVEMGRAVNG